MIIQFNNLKKSYSMERLAGADRFSTNKAVNGYIDDQAGTSPRQQVWVATGMNFPDALSAAAPAGDAKNRLVLSNGTCMPKEAVSWIDATNSKVDQLNLVGGTGVLKQSVYNLSQCK